MQMSCATFCHSTPKQARLSQIDQVPHQSFFGTKAYLDRHPQSDEERPRAAKHLGD
jgi:hypothetical protein